MWDGFIVYDRGCLKHVHYAQAGKSELHRTRVAHSYLAKKNCRMINQAAAQR